MSHYDSTYCKFHGFRVYENICAICAGTSRMVEVAPGEYEPLIDAGFTKCPVGVPSPYDASVSQTGNTFSLETFLSEVKDSCTNHAERKGYTTDQGSDAGDIFGATLTRMGIAKDHAIGEIIAKLIEYKREPRRVLAVKVAGWAWRLWLNTEK